MPLFFSLKVFIIQVIYICKKNTFFSFKFKIIYFNNCFLNGMVFKITKFVALKINFENEFRIIIL